MIKLDEPRMILLLTSSVADMFIKRKVLFHAKRCNKRNIVNVLLAESENLA